MKFGSLIKSAVLFPVLALGFQGTAFAGDSQYMTRDTGSMQRDAASGLPTGKRQHKPLVVTKEVDKSTPKLADTISSGNPNPQPIGLLLPAVQKVREAAAR